MESKPIDTQHLTDLSGGDTVFEVELIQEFLNCTPLLLEGLKTSIQQPDLRAALINAHTLKGSCRSLGAFTMSNPCEQLETMAREGNLEGAEEIFASIEAEYENLKAFMFHNWNLSAA